MPTVAMDYVLNATVAQPITASPVTLSSKGEVTTTAAAMHTPPTLTSAFIRCLTRAAAPSVSRNAALPTTAPTRTPLESAAEGLSLPSPQTTAI